MNDDTIAARAADVIRARYPSTLGQRAADVLATDLAAAGLLATPPDDTTASLIEALAVWREGRSTTGDLLAAHDAYLAAHPEATL